MENGKLRFVIKSHGLVDHGISYAPHLFRDSEDCLLQLGWADEASRDHVRKAQGWAGCMTQPKELFEISKPITEEGRKSYIWRIDESSSTMITLGMCPAPQISTLKSEQTSSSLESFTSILSKNYELEATFSNLSSTEKFTFNIRESPNSAEFTKLIFDIAKGQIIVDRTHSSLENLGTNTPRRRHLLFAIDTRIPPQLSFNEGKIANSDPHTTELWAHRDTTLFQFPNSTPFSLSHIWPDNQWSHLRMNKVFEVGARQSFIICDCLHTLRIHLSSKLYCILADCAHGAATHRLKSG